MKIAMIGLGFMGSTHLKALSNIPGAELVAVSSADPKQLSGDLSGVQGNIGGPGEKLDFSNLRRYADAMEAARDPEVEAVDICLPTSLHAPVAIEALRHGKHVLVEKPMAIDGTAADQMIEEAARQSRILMTAQVLRFWPEYVVMHDLVKGGSVGQVRAGMFRRRCAAPTWGAWIADPKVSGGGIFDLLIHDVDICLHLFGAPEALASWGYEDMPHGIDILTSEFYYPEIGTVTVTGGWHHPKAYPFSAEYTVVADGGTIEFSTAGRPATLYKANGEAQTLPVAQKSGYQAEIEYFLDCVKANRQPEICPPAESSLAVKLTRLMVEARKRKGEKVSCHF
jgi:predicted dehydrogenase